MAIRLKVRKNKQIVVPIRFVRAVSGDTVVDAPEVDDRGFTMGARPGTWGSTDTRGAMVSIQEGDTVRVRVLREDIDADAPIFIASTNPSVAAISGAAGPLGSDGVFQIEGVKDLKNVPVKIQARLGSADGPVLGELEPHVFQLRQLRVRAHIMSINGVSTSHTAADLVDFFKQVNVFWRNAGIEFLYSEAETRFGNIRGFKVDGQVTTDFKKEDQKEFGQTLNFVDKVTGDKPDPNAINVYFVRLANEFIGATLSRDVPRPDGFGVVLADFMNRRVQDPPFDSGNPRSLAHELGHYLNSPIHSDQFFEGAKPENDSIYCERRLMFSSSGLVDNQIAYRKEIGYGARQSGSLISVKDLSPDASDGEIARNRFRALNPN